ncbi:hypothetical protein B0H14DRAFT_2574566 [Mycena olivaceomarginata]|nr:hypothetical protein B0H14DRAFT_2574566 [Mycena olivaceomarginata]
MSGGELDHHIMNAQAEVYKLKSEFFKTPYIDQDPLNYGLALLNVAEVDVYLGAPKDDVLRNVEVAKKIFNTMKYVREAISCDAVLAELHSREENMLVAQTMFLQVIKLCLGNNSEMVSYCLEGLGRASYMTSSWTTVFLVNSLKTKEKLGIYKALQSLGDVFLTQDDENTACNLFMVALEAFTYMDVHRSRAECLLRLGDISRGHGDLLKAVEFWETARPLFERSSQAKQVENINERLDNIRTDVLEQHKMNLCPNSKREYWLDTGIEHPYCVFWFGLTAFTEPGSIESSSVVRDPKGPLPLDIQELVDHCISFLWESKPDLIVCALVARSWVNPAQCHLLRAPSGDVDTFVGVRERSFATLQYTKHLPASHWLEKKQGQYAANIRDNIRPVFGQYSPFLRNIGRHHYKSVKMVLDGDAGGPRGDGNRNRMRRPVLGVAIGGNTSSRCSRD